MKKNVLISFFIGMKNAFSAFVAGFIFVLNASFFSGCAFLDFNKSARLSGYEQTRQNLAITSSHTKTATSTKTATKSITKSSQNNEQKDSTNSTNVATQGTQTTLGAGVLAESGLVDLDNTKDFAQSIQSKEDFILSELYKQQESWASTPYRSGGIKREGADCSGFVMVVFDESFSLQLPRITLNQMAQGEKIAGRHIGSKKLRPADLLFFRTGRGAHGYHVGIYLQNGDFMHLSTKGGAKIVNISNKYWKDRLRKVVRYEIP
ncbi:NlpC/P60 family protein [Helicobacter sp. T3_23-1059]